MPGRVPQGSLASGSSGLGAGVAPSQPIAMPSAPLASSLGVHEGTVLGPWSERFKDLRVQTVTAAGSKNTRTFTSISGTAPTPPAPASFTAQAGTERPGSLGTADSSSPLEGLSPRSKEARIKEAHRVFGCKVSQIQQAVMHNSNAEATGLVVFDVAARQLIAAERKKLDRSLSDIERPVQRPESNEPQHRIVGFKTSP